ncbi:hypothetical protein B0J11DRAFT_68643 [Dendryphion nanum]|uniref:Secreted protein n=1 Tax=Dendryphion nanum TaxID=256645 RepID=A0A9P9DIB5_9PLEO|nr:hypothetical protein B0J11DRAFT_68643 [Dendryphion nanum]
MVLAFNLSLWLYPFNATLLSCGRHVTLNQDTPHRFLGIYFATDETIGQNFQFLHHKSRVPECLSLVLVPYRYYACLVSTWKWLVGRVDRSNRDRDWT